MIRLIKKISSIKLMELTTDDFTTHLEREITPEVATWPVVRRSARTKQVPGFYIERANVSDSQTRANHLERSSRKF